LSPGGRPSVLHQVVLREKKGDDQSPRKKEQPTVTALHKRKRRDCKASTEGRDGLRSGRGRMKTTARRMGISFWRKKWPLQDADGKRCSHTWEKSNQEAEQGGKDGISSKKMPKLFKAVWEPSPPRSGKKSRTGREWGSWQNA